MFLLGILCQKGWGNIFKEQANKAVHFPERVFEDWIDFWPWEATDLLVMMGIDIGEWKYNRESSGSSCKRLTNVKK